MRAQTGIEATAVPPRDLKRKLWGGDCDWLQVVAPDAMLVTLEGRFAYANPAAANLLGAKDVQEVVGKSPFEFLDSSSHEMARERIRMMLEEGKQFPTTEYRLSLKAPQGGPETRNDMEDLARVVSSLPK